MNAKRKARLTETVNDRTATDKTRVEAFLKLNPRAILASQVADGVGIPHEAVMCVFEQRRAERRY